MIYYISNTPFKEDPINISIAAQKFNKLFMKGFCDNNLKVIALGHFASIPMIDCYEENPKLTFVTLLEKPGKLKYLNRMKEIRQYLKTNNIDKSNDILVYDCLNYVNVFAALTLHKSFYKTIGIITDLPEFFIREDSSFNEKMINIVYKTISNIIYKKTKVFIFLSENMKYKINTKHKKYLTIYGFIDENLYKYKKNSNYTKKIIYAGSLDKKYGIQELIQAVILSDKYFYLDIYGKGDIENGLINIAEKYPNINYYGQLSYDEYLKKLFTADILINPRSVSHEFTKYSFPSKNIEYMSTGIPFASTNLCGMDIYEKYVTIITDESPIGILKSLQSIDQNYEEKSSLANQLRNDLYELNSPKNIVNQIMKLCFENVMEECENEKT